MTYLSRRSFADTFDLIHQGRVSAETALNLARCNRWLARTPLWMRLKIIWTLKATLLLFAFPVMAQVGDVTLQWQATHPLSTNNVWVLRGSPVLSGSPTNWPVLTNVSGLSTQATVRITPGAFFFVAQSSNLWGISPPSNVAATPALPVPPLLSIQGAQ